MEFCRISTGQKKGRCRKGVYISRFDLGRQTMLDAEPKHGSGDSEVYRFAIASIHVNYVYIHYNVILRNRGTIYLPSLDGSITNSATDKADVNSAVQRSALRFAWPLGQWRRQCREVWGVLSVYCRHSREFRPVQLSVRSLFIRRNLDGFVRDAVRTRCDASGETSPYSFRWPNVATRHTN